jgi:hypothetical protein
LSFIYFLEIFLMFIEGIFKTFVHLFVVFLCQVNPFNRSSSRLNKDIRFFFRFKVKNRSWLE